MDNPIELVSAMGWEYKIEADQIRVKVCPFCSSDDWQFRINSYTGMWDCKHINRHSGKNTHGNIFRLKKALGLTVDVLSQQHTVHPLGYVEHKLVEDAHARLLNDGPKMAVICDEWKITEAVVRKWQIGYREDKAGTGFIVIPQKVGGDVCNIKFRTWFGFPKAFHRVTGASSVLFNEDVLNTVPETALLCEGEKDAIIADMIGLPNPVGMTGGAGTLLERWYNLLEPVKHIYIAYDGDVAGQEGTQKLIKRLGSHRVKIVPLPSGKDIADIYKDNGAQAVLDLYARAQEQENTSITSVNKAVSELILMEPQVAMPTPWLAVNKILNGGTFPSQVIVVVAPPKIGKTTWSLVFAYWTASVLRVPALLWCVEMPRAALTQYVVGAAMGVGRKPTKADMFVYNHRSKDVPFYLGYDNNTEIDVIIQAFRDAHARFGIELFVFDNIHFAVRNVDDKVQAMENAMQKFKKLAMELNTRIIIVAHPKKIDPKKGSDITYYDIGWSASFASDADTIIVLHRDRVVDMDNSFKPEMMVKCDAGRYTPGGTTYLYFRDERLQFREMSRSEIKALIANR